MNKKLSTTLALLVTVALSYPACSDEIGSFEFTGGSLAFTDADPGDGITVSSLDLNGYTNAQMFDGPDPDAVRIDASEAPNGTGSAFEFSLFWTFDITNNTGADLELGQFTIDYRGENVGSTFQARVFNAPPLDIVADTIARLGKPNGGTDDDFVTDQAILDGTSGDSGANFFGVATIIPDGQTVTFFLPFNTSGDDPLVTLDLDNLTICLTVPVDPVPKANLLATFEFTGGSLSPTDADPADGVTVSDLNINSYTPALLFDADTPDEIRIDGLETQASTGNAFKFGELFSFDVTNNSGSDLNMDSLRIDYQGTNVFGNFAARVFTAPPVDVVADTIGRLGKEDGGSDPVVELDIAFLDGTDPGAGENAAAPVVIPDGGTVTFFLPFTMNSNSDTRFLDLDNLTVNSSLGEDCLPGDVNLDGEVSLLDVAPFVDALVNGIFSCEADVNEDGFVDLLDVDPFVTLLTGGG